MFVRFANQFSNKSLTTLQRIQKQSLVRKITNFNLYHLKSCLIINLAVVQIQMLTPKDPRHDQQQHKQYTIIPLISNPTIPYFEIPTHLLDQKQTIFHPSNWELKDFQIGRHIGKGKYGHIYLARERKSKYVVVLKVQFKKQLVSEQALSSIRKEIEIQSHLRHPNIVKFYGFFHDETKIFYILEYCSGGELYKKLMKTKGFGEKQSSHYVRQFIDALQYISQNKIAHRDIKPENILLDGQDNIKLADFGFATQIQKRRKSYCGTLLYMSPQILHDNYYDRSVDLWALGVLAYELTCSKAPFESETSLKTKMNILKVKYTFPQQFSKQLRDFISRLLQQDKNKRMTLQQARQHKWIKLYKK